MRRPSQPAAPPNRAQYSMRPPILDEKSGWKVAGPPPPLSVATAESLLARWLGSRRILDVRPLDGGLLNRNYRFVLAGSPESFVLRIFDRDPAACAKEAAVLTLVRDDVPVPEVLHIEANGGEGFPPLLVLSFIDGISLRELKNRGDARSIADAAHDAGRVLARIARHAFDRSGLLTPELEIDSGELEGATICDMIDRFARSAVFRRRVDAELIRRLIAWTRASEEQFGVFTDTALVHGDFNSANIFVREERDRWVVAAILDWEFTFAGPVWCDIGNMLRYERPDRRRFEPHFSRGCIDGGLLLADDWRQRARLADLPALCELLTRDAIPEPVVDELRELLAATVYSEGI